MNDLICLILVSGQLVVGKHIREDEFGRDITVENTRLENPIEAIRTPQGIVFLPYCPVSDESIFDFDDLDIRQVVSDVTRESKETWNKMFGAGLALATTLPQ